MWWNRRANQRDLMVQMAELTRTLREVSAKLPEKGVQITVESLHVDKATLESLVFRMDSLDIDELSGSLNLGNNFGPTPDRDTKSIHHVRLGDRSASGPRTQHLSETPLKEVPIHDYSKEPTPAHQGDTPAAETQVSQRHPPLHEDGHVRETNRGYVIRF
jgi:hypothetical protein